MFYSNKWLFFYIQEKTFGICYYYDKMALAVTTNRAEYQQNNAIDITKNKNYKGPKRLRGSIFFQD